MKTKLRRSLAAFLVLAMVLGLSACSSSNETSADAAATQTEAVPTTEKEAGSESTSAAASVNGTFEGVGYGMQGEIHVSIEVKDGVITDVTVGDNKETPTVAKVALERIPEQIVEYQSLSVDTVTGATLASNGILNAAADAAEQAGLDVDELKANNAAAAPGADEVWDTDVLVMGGGGAGFSAAITAAEAGADVILIEKGSVLGGNTLVSGSAFNAVDPEAQSSMILTAAQKETMDSYLALDENDESLKLDEFPEWKEVLTTLKNDINEFYIQNSGTEPGVDMPGFDSISLHMWHIYTGGLRQLDSGEWIASDVELARVLAANALSTFEWMESIGLESMYGSEASPLYTVLGAMWPRTHNFLSYGPRIDQLKTVAEGYGVKVYTETSGEELIMEDGKVVGAIAEQADGTRITINTANGVVLATGGYCANAAMVKEYDEYWGDALTENTLSTNLGTNEGDGIVMAQAVGAGVTGLEISQMMPSSSPTKGTMTDGVWGDASSQIWVDSEGSRFVNEYAERDVLTKASLELDGGIFYIIYAGSSTEETLKGASLDDTTGFGDRIGDLVDSGQIWYGETLAELVEAAKTSAAGCTPAFTEEELRATIEAYNTYVENQHDDEFGKEVLSGAIDLDYIESTEGVGICITPRKASLHHTMGGVVIDTQARVLDTEGEVIQGLWAAGEVTGGVHAGNRLGGNAIADIFTFGRIAGQSAAGTASGDRSFETMDETGDVEETTTGFEN